ncbi:hypothetical protein [Lentzea tibetensis]|uniref:hypothetical protein n=1 Tax=Lentzea tibetensis TaxID=2591470 RepID=UPI0016441680|nr:hypothetical protein [Lentzea tibetensis]
MGPEQLHFSPAPADAFPLLAAGVALWRMPGRPRQFASAAGLVLALVGLLFAAGVLVPA